MLFLANIAGWIMSHARQLLIGGAILAVVLTSAIIYTKCTRQKTITPEQINKAQEAIAKQDREKMEQVLVEIEADKAAIDQSVANAEAEREFAIAEAKKKAETMTNAELAAELERLANE